MAAPGGFFADRTEQTMTIVIPEKLLVSLRRDGLYFDGQLADLTAQAKGSSV